ncbi:MAG: hypothetical protein H6Q67_1719 [Firmicutes bacterium]|nr:hypothetical protein [Bacillota bacterium]
MNAAESQPTVKYNGELTISIGKSRKETEWKNKQLLWSDLLRKLSHTIRTHETVAEYDAMTKTEQDAIKDVGAFVGGALKGGRRQSKNAVWRQLVTLDADFAKPDFWDTVTLLNDFAACVYSTHKYRKDKPRLRLCVPLSRPVNPDEYQAISRWVASGIGMDLFDETTYQPHRLMYWPSTSIDGEFYFQQQDGRWLDPDEVLASYGHDEAWKDQANWPESGRTIIQSRKKAADRQGDPLEKPGVVGAFCRTYDIQTAIDTFLNEIYTPCAALGRYTYIPGSTAGGLVIYEDKFAYSHHGTDPVGSLLVNAFDLVRIHKFGDEDENAEQGTPVNRLPSYKAMLEFATGLDDIKLTLGQERLAEVEEDFGKINDADNNNWLTKLVINRQGKYEPTIDNIYLILNYDPNIKNRVALDVFTERTILVEDLPWRKLSENECWTDADDSCLRYYIEKTYEIDSVRKINDALDATLTNHSFHPVRDYLDSLIWDGTQRVDDLFITYLGAEDNEYTRAVTRKTLVAAVARIKTPGCKFDTMPILIGKQGCGKSTIFNRLGGPWYSDSLVTVQGKEACEQIQGKWIIEMGELKAFTKAEDESIKQFLSKQDDYYRAAYAKRTITRPRQCIIVGTTNKPDFIKDDTGGRRFWPITVLECEPTKNVFNDLTKSEVAQIWAEAVELFKAGETIYLNEKVREMAEERQEAHSEQSDKAGMVEEYLETLLPVNWENMNLPERREFLEGGDFGNRLEGTVKRESVCNMEIWAECFGNNPTNLELKNSKEIRSIMNRIKGWRYDPGSKKSSKIYGRQKAYKKV